MAIQKKIILPDLLLFLFLMAVYLVATLFLFHRQSVNYGGWYVSDLPVYIAEMQGDSGRRFPYPILFLTGRLFLPFTSPAHAMAFATTLLNSLTLFVLKYYCDRLLQLQETDRAAKRLFSTLLVYTLLFVSMLYPLTYLGSHHNRYIGTFSPNPYHNATYLAARPFSIPAFFLFADILSFYEEENIWFHPKYLGFSLALFLTTLAKPSFTLVLVSAAGVIMLWRLFTRRFRKFKAFFQLGVWFIPTFLVLLYQFGDVYTTGGNTKSSISFGFLTVWGEFADNIPRAILLGTAFPLAVLLFSALQKQVPKLLRFSWQFYLTALISLAFLYEKGYRMYHLNFAWGYMYALFFTYSASLIVLGKNTLQRRQPLPWLAAQWTVYSLHLICGIDYFRVLLSGETFH